MQAEIINSFLTSAFSVMETVLGSAPARGDLGVKPVASTHHQVNVVCGVTGHVAGQVIYGMSLATADQIASKMCGMPIKVFDQLAASAISELGNMISGNAMLKLAEAHFICDITPPSLIRGANVEISTPAVPAIMIPLKTEFGEVCITVAFQPGHK